MGHYSLPPSLHHDSILTHPKLNQINASTFKFTVENELLVGCGINCVHLLVEFIRFGYLSLNGESLMEAAIGGKHFAAISNQQIS